MDRRHRRASWPIALALVAIGGVGCAAETHANGAIGRSSQAPQGPELAIAGGVPAARGGRAKVPVRFAAHGAAVSGIVLSVDYDSRVLALDPADSDGDGVPDAVAIRVPAQFVAIVNFDPQDRKGEIDIVVQDLLPPLAAIPDGDLLEITLDVLSTAPTGTTPVRFSRDPSPSFGSTTGAAVAGSFQDGSVEVGELAVPKAYLPLLKQQD